MQGFVRKESFFKRNHIYYAQPSPQLLQGAPRWP